MNRIKSNQIEFAFSQIAQLYCMLWPVQLSRVLECHGQLCNVQNASLEVHQEGFQLWSSSKMALLVKPYAKMAANINLLFPFTFWLINCDLLLQRAQLTSVTITDNYSYRLWSAICLLLMDMWMQYHCYINTLSFATIDCNRQWHTRMLSTSKHYASDVKITPVM